MRIYPRFIAGISLLFQVAWAFAQVAEPAPFTDGTRVVAIGDSITNMGQYHSYVHLYELTRFPQSEVEMLNAGISGDTAAGCLQRYDWDIAPQRADVATVMFGMNDVAGGDIYPETGGDTEAIRQKRLARVDAYERSMRALVERLMRDGIDPILIKPSIYDETSTMPASNQPGRNWSLGECGKRVQAIADENDLTVIDFYGPMSELSLELQQDDPAFTIIGQDRVHPGDSGHLVMAYLTLKALDAPSDVARVTVDARRGIVTEDYRCGIGEVNVMADGVEFEYMAEALPFPVDAAAQPALDWVPFTDELNREIMRVTHLPAGQYRLSIDGEAVRDFSAAELASGVNLATEASTPQYRQAQEVLDLYKKLYRAPVSKLRAIAFVEHSSSRSAPHPLTLEQVEPKLEAWIASAEGQPYQGYFRKCAEAYRVDKPREQEYTEQAAASMAVIRAAAQPQEHRVSVTRVN